MMVLVAFIDKAALKPAWRSQGSNDDKNMAEPKEEANIEMIREIARWRTGSASERPCCI